MNKQANQAQTSTTVKTADAVTGSWVYRKAPDRLRPWLKLARIDRPVGTWLLLWPCWWSILMASDGFYLHTLIFMSLFGVGALVMRGAGCTLNDIIDRDFDKLVERTKSRPIPAGEISVKQAIAFMVLLSVIGLLVLITLNDFAIIVGASSLILVALYPFMKRITYWPQAWLGLTFNWGALLGWAAVRGDISLPAILLYIGGVFWTLGYDTIYAHQDKDDDAMIGVKSTALALGDKTRPALMFFYSGFLICLILAGYLAKLGIFYYVSLTFAAIQLAWQIIKVDINDPAVCLNIFRSNIAFGWIIFFGLTLDLFL
jgi:4-hydroxybenzoate polyprenyltransferase